MAEAVSAPTQATITDKVKVSYINKQQNTVRLIFLSGIDKDQNLEFSISGAQVDARIQTGDMPIEATTQGGKLISLKFPPGMEPAGQLPAKPVTPPQTETKPVTPIQKPATQNQTGDSKPYNMKGILRKKQLDPGKDFYGFSMERIKEGKPTGDVKFYSLTSLENEKTLVESLQDLQEGHEIDYVQKNFQPVKVGPKGSLNSFGGGFRGKPYDPEADKRRQILIVRQSCLDKATQLYIAKFGDKLKEIQGSHVTNITAIAEEFEDWVMRE